MGWETLDRAVEDGGLRGTERWIVGMGRCSEDNVNHLVNTCDRRGSSSSVVSRALTVHGPGQLGLFSSDRHVLVCGGEDPLAASVWAEALRVINLLLCSVCSLHSPTDEITPECFTDARPRPDNPLVQQGDGSSSFPADHTPTVLDD